MANGERKQKQSNQNNIMRAFIKGPFTKYGHNYGRVSFKIDTAAAYRGKGCHASCVRTHSSLFMIWTHVCLMMSCVICRNLTLTLFK